MQWGPISLSNSVFWADIFSVAPKLAAVLAEPFLFPASSVHTTCIEQVCQDFLSLLCDL